MALTRRAFLERTGWAIAALGLSQSSFFAIADRHQQALAQSTRGRLALLVGINQYPESVCDFAPIKGTALAGCLTDVALQKELLLSRFGFAPSEVLTLTDAQATRSGIINAFQEHLIAGARPADKVLFHFSGLGSRVRSLPAPSDNPDEATAAGEEISTLVPVDGTLPTEDKPFIRDLSLGDLRTLTQALPTPNVTTVLDVAFVNQGMPLQGNFRIRSRPSIPMGQLQPPEALAALSQNVRRGDEALAGLALFAAKPHQPALEGHWSGFSAGFLTYALTQYMWEMMPPKKLQVVFPKLVNRVYQRVGGSQQPCLEKERSTESLYSLKPELPASEGFIKRVDEDGLLQIWLGGLPAQVLECYGSGSRLQAGVAGQQVELVGRSRTGLMVKAAIAPTSDVSANSLVGQPVFESVRLIPCNLNLTIALDPSLERIERVDATSAFAAAKVNVVAAGEQSADLVFGKASLNTVTASLNHSGLANGAAQSSYGLFYPPHVAVPGTVASGEEAVKTAVNRLLSKLPRLLAIKYLQLTENVTSSKLTLRATLKTAESNPQVITRIGTRTAMVGKAAEQLDASIPVVATATSLECHIQNLDNVPLHLLWVLLPEASRPISVSMLPGDQMDASATAIAPGDTFTFPQAAFGSGLVEIFLIASPKPFQKTANLIANQQSNGRNSDPVEVSLQRVQTILQDLSAPSAANDAYALNVQDWATLRLRYRIT